MYIDLELLADKQQNASERHNYAKPILTVVTSIYVLFDFFFGLLLMI